jgi:hypothetical protein
MKNLKDYLNLLNFTSFDGKSIDPKTDPEDEKLKHHQVQSKNPNSSNVVL